MSGDEEYVAVDCWIVRRTDDAVLLRVGSWNSAKQAWIPRRVLYGPDEKVMALLAPGARMTLRMFAWKAKDEDLLPDAPGGGAAQPRLFEQP